MKIQKLLSNSSFLEDIDLVKKINEIIDLVNEIDKRTQGSTYIGPGPSPYDLSAFPRKKK